MSTAVKLSCPYCFVALMGSVLLAALPELALHTFPMGEVWVWLLLIPLLSTVIKTMLLLSNDNNR